MADKKSTKITNYEEFKNHFGKNEKPKNDGLFLAPISEELHKKDVNKKLPLPNKNVAP